MAGDDHQDPVSATLGDLGELGSSDEHPETATILPQGFDLFSITPKSLDSIRAKGLNPRITKVRVYPVHNGKKGQMLAEYTPEGLTLEWFRAHHPPGVYDLQGLQEDRMWIGGERVVVDRNGHSPNGGNGHGMDGIMHDMLRTMVQKGMAQSNAGNMNDVFGALAKTIAMQSTMMSNQMAMQMAQMDAERKPRESDNKMQLEFLKMMNESADRNQKLMIELALGKNGRNGSSAKGQFGDFVGAMQMGMELTGMMNKNSDDDRAKWELMIPKLVDSIGPGLIAVVAQAFPEEKAKMVIDLIQQHMKARTAEAEADSDEPFDTTGEAVPA